MGIVINQSFKNTISTYLGFGIGAINTLFLYTNFISDTHYGLVAFILSTANIMMPLLAFGAHNTLVKFYSTFKTKQTLNSFLTLMLFLPMVIIIPLMLVGFFGYHSIASLLSQENEIVKGYLWHIFITAIGLAYFEVFFAWSKTQMQTVFGNFMKEVFHRLCIMLLLFAVYFNYLTVPEFINAVVGVYLLRMVIMKIYAYIIRWPVLKFNKIEALVPILKYSFLIILAGSVATLILDIDKFMLGQYLPIKQVAYYSVAIFIATVISVPQRAMHQILLPLTAQLLNNKDRSALKTLYQKSSVNLFAISGLIFVLIIVNTNQLFLIIPEEFRGGFLVVFLISLAKLYDALLGANNAILFNSDYYRVVLLFGVLLAILIVALNMLFIPLYGIEGAAMATFLAICIYNTVKIYFVHLKFKMLPYTKGTLKSLVIILVGLVLFFFWEFPFGPVLNMILKSVIVVVLYVFMLLKLNVSEDLSTLFNTYLRLK